MDAVGNTTARGGDSFAYDQANRLTRATVSGITSTYTWDGDGKRATASTGGTTTTYRYDTAVGLPRLLSDGTRTYVWGAAGLAYTITRASGAIEVGHADALGSVRALTDATGTLIQTYRTDAFGVPTATQDPSVQPFRFTGEQVDPTGLIYLRARMYDPQAGRFLQRDTLVQGGQGSQGLNRYTYVQNNPVNLTDPSGQCVWDLCVAEGTAALAVVGAVTSVAAGVAAWELGQALGAAVSQASVPEPPGFPPAIDPEKLRASTVQPENPPPAVQTSVQPPNPNDPWWIKAGYWGALGARLIERVAKALTDG